MRPERRAARMLEQLPLALRGGANIQRLFAGLAGELTSAEQGLVYLLRARWYRLARGWSRAEGEIDGKVATELGMLAGLFGVEPLPGEASAGFRRRLRGEIELHREGLTTASAILQLAAAVYLPEDSPRIFWVGETAVAEFTAKGARGPEPVRLELIDNPRGPARAEATLGPAGRLEARNTGLDPAKPEIHITAHEALVLPQVVHLESDLRVLYVGALGAGEQLVLRHRQPPLRDGRRADAPVLVYNPVTFNEPEARFRFARKLRGRVLQAGARFSVFEAGANLPPLPVGESHWEYKPIAPATLLKYLSFWSERSRIPTPTVAKASDSPIDLELRWEESRAACFELRAPAFVPKHLRGDLSSLARGLQRAIDYGRAAGVQGLLTIALPTMQETLALHDELASTIDIAMTERVEAHDEITRGGSLHLHEQISADDPRFYASGPFGARRFDAALFGSARARGGGVEEDAVDNDEEVAPDEEDSHHDG